MTDFLVAVPVNGRLAVEIRRDEPAGAPYGWQSFERDHPHAWCRPLTEEEMGLDFATIAQRAREEDAQRRPKPQPKVAAPGTPRGIFVTAAAVKDMMRWSLMCRGEIMPNQDFEVSLGRTGAFIVPGKVRQGEA